MTHTSARLASFPKRRQTSSSDGALFNSKSNANSPVVRTATSPGRVGNIVLLISEECRARQQQWRESEGRTSCGDAPLDHERRLAPAKRSSALRKWVLQLVVSQRR